MLFLSDFELFMITPFIMSMSNTRMNFSIWLEYLSIVGVWLEYLSIVSVWLELNISSGNIRSLDVYLSIVGVSFLQS